MLNLVVVSDTASILMVALWSHAIWVVMHQWGYVVRCSLSSLSTIAFLFRYFVEDPMGGI